MTQPLTLLPRPVVVAEKEGRLDLSHLHIAIGCGWDAAVREALLERFPFLCLQEQEGEGFSLQLTGEGTAPAAAEPPHKPDGYLLQISDGGIRVDADTAAGLFYAVQTLRQLPEECPCARIEDYAALPLRMIHWDLKGYLPHFSVLKEEFRRLAAYKVNAVLLEIEDKYDYRCAPGIGVPGAYTFEQFRELSRLAKDLHISIVPKLQSIAHVDYILKHERYRHLREGGPQGHVFQYCPMHPEVEVLWEAMCDELMECFSEHGPYFHIGADESMYLGECPTCKALGAAKVYLHKVGQSIDYVCRKGWTPIIWDDIARNENKTFSPEEEAALRGELGSRAVFMYWKYGYDGKDNVFPYTEEYVKAGMRVWGASGYSGCDNWMGSVPPLATRTLNTDAWMKEAQKYGLECVCATGWTRIGSADCPADPQEGAWFSILYAASALWNPETFDIDTFIESLFPQLYGRALDEDLREVLRHNGKAQYDYHKALESSPDEGDALQFLRYAAGAEYARTTLQRLENFQMYFQGKLGDRMEDYRLDMMKEWAQKAYDDLTKFRAELYRALSRYYQPVTVEDFVRSRLDYLLKWCRQILTLLEHTLPF